MSAILTIPYFTFWLFLQKNNSFQLDAHDDEDAGEDADENVMP